MHFLQLPFLFVSMSVDVVFTNALHPLVFQGFLPMTGTGWPGGGACLPAVSMAIRDVNARQGLLDGYNVTYTWVDTQCKAGLATFQMLEALKTPPTKIMLLGCGCSTAAEATAQVSHLYNLTQLAYGASSPTLSDRKRFPNFFRVSGPDQKLNPAKIAMMDMFNWKRVATINQALEFFSLVVDDFVNRVKGTDIQIITQEIFQHDPTTRVENLKNKDARIIVTACYEDKARLMLCSAYKLGLYGPKIVWIFVAWYSSDFWLRDLEEIPCTAEEMSLAADGAFVIGFYYRNPLPERGISGLTAQEFDQLYTQEDTYDPQHYMYEFVAAKCYDHVWVAALALNCTETYLAHMDSLVIRQIDNTSPGDAPVGKLVPGSHKRCKLGHTVIRHFSGGDQRIGEVIPVPDRHTKTLADFTYEDSFINDIIVSCMSNVSIIGVVGSISFEGGGDPINDVKIERIQGGRREGVGTYVMNHDPKHFVWIGNGIQWKDGYIPRDSTYVISREILVPIPLYVCMCVCAGLGILAAIGFFSFNIVHRHNSIVKLSSPNINNVLLLGCIMTYSTVFMKTTGNDRSDLCRARTFCFCIGFTIAFGALFSKTWRVYKIFTNKKLLKLTIKDAQLITLVCAFTCCVVLILIVWEIIGPQVHAIKHLTKEIYVIGNDAEIHPYVRVCYSAYGVYFSWAIYILEGALLAFGAFLAWETRHVKIEALNDSRQIGMCVYNVFVLSAVGLTFSLLLEDKVVEMYGIISGCVIIGTTLTQAIVFVPKVLAVYGFQTASIQPMESIGSKTVASHLSAKHVSAAAMSFTGSSQA